MARCPAKKTLSLQLRCSREEHTDGRHSADIKEIRKKMRELVKKFTKEKK